MQRSWNHWRMEPEEVQRRLIEAKLHLDFCIEVYEFQLKNGRHFLHEHPATATSWIDAEMQKLLAKKGLHTTIGHMCQYGMKSVDRDGVENQ